MTSKKTQQQQQQPDPERQLMIKTKACQRLIKEVAFYEKEVQDNESQLQTMKLDSTKTQFDIKKFIEVVDESRMMIPDSKRRLDDALRDLEEFVTSQQLSQEQSSATSEAEQSSSSSSSEWYTTAKSLLDEHLLHIHNTTTKGQSSSVGGDVTTEEETTNVDDLKEGEAF
mmetsp:Transcript_34321/g.82679  ORF Transcript_34321/g.82679 Transcript_34321/m.82679 type:complete len:170 (+) Transcript_34321:162-671(+)|eukprot:CAMPEP_0113475500 /NCGR_PEP_ID=MMETSP0014_2-20120614/19154_1 /TAXON_ID=2857 /ORGANISM="Nitzschia sp." /LENGTH=169 /DNA_ID=CAMNT_0000368425 /DNA_START=132 /DNA_END=641 /DNA_ORIENTATION=- /assembly_acc=CAM_ASM_000159